jgi:RimJ/RimL family protein N-acetyltransferase
LTLQTDLDPGQAVGVLLRDATPSDVSALLEVQRGGAVLALGEVFPQEVYPFPIEEIRARGVAELADPDIDAYVIVDGIGDVVGFAATRGSELLHFGTAVETWGTGLAARALAEIVDRLTLAGVTVARLRVFEDNRRARRFYGKQGWVPTSRRTRTSFPPYPVLVEYERRLRAD